MQSENYANQPAEVSAYLQSEAVEERSGWLRHRMRLIILVGVIALP